MRSKRLKLKPGHSPLFLRLQLSFQFCGSLVLLVLLCTKCTRPFPCGHTALLWPTPTTRWSPVSLYPNSWLDGKESVCDVGDLGLTSVLERSPGEVNGYPPQDSFLFFSPQYSWLENSMDRGAWQAVVHGVAKSQTRLSNWHFHFFH